MPKIDTIQIEVNGVKSDFLIMDKETAEQLADAISKLLDLTDNDAKQDENINSALEAIKKITVKDTETDKTLSNYNDRITEAKENADSAVGKYNALSKVVDGNASKISDEIQRAKDVEGELDQLETTPKDDLVTAINWVLSKANKGLENVGALTDLSTTEKTDLVKALNEVVKSLSSTDKKVEQNKKDLGNIAFSVTENGLLHVEKKEA